MGILAGNWQMSTGLAADRLFNSIQRCSTLAKRLDKSTMISNKEPAAQPEGWSCSIEQPPSIVANLLFFKQKKAAQRAA